MIRSWLSIESLLGDGCVRISSGIYQPIDALRSFDQASESYHSTLIALHKGEPILHTFKSSIGGAYSFIRIANPILNNIAVRISRGISKKHFSGPIVLVG